MRRFLAKLIVFLGAHLAFLAVSFALYVHRFPPGDSLYAASSDKLTLLQTQASPRLIFVGGSSMAFGMDSGLVASRCGFHPVNMGLHLGIGLEFMLQEVEPLVRSGDVVVVSPEYHTFETYYWAEPEYMARLLECSPSVWRVLSWRQAKALLDEGYVHHLGRILRGRWDRSIAGFDQAVNEHTRRQAFNSNGDQISHHPDKVAQPLGRGAPLRFTFSQSPTVETAIAHLNRFHAVCAGRGARVFFSHPPYERRYFQAYKGAILQLDDLLRRKLSIPMLDEAQEMTFPSEEIFDLEYHLNLAGKLKRSELVALRLRRALQAP